jgi:hypothetical protein
VHGTPLARSRTEVLARVQGSCVSNGIRFSL